AFLDADDEWDPTFLQEAVRHLSTHDDCAAFTCSFRLGPHRVDRWEELSEFGFTEGPWRLNPQIDRAELAHCLAAFSSSTVVYRRGVLESYSGFYTKGRCTFGEDVYLWIQVLLHHEIYRHMGTLAHYH